MGCVRSGGLTNPLEVIEQLTCLMFIHDLDDTDNKNAKECAMLSLPFKSIFSDQVKIVITDHLIQKSSEISLVSAF